MFAYSVSVTFLTHVPNVLKEKTVIFYRQTCEVGGGRLESLARVYSSGGDGPASHHAAYAASLSAIHQQRQRAQRRYAELVSNILKHEPDLQVC